MHISVFVNSNDTLMENVLLKVQQLQLSLSRLLHQPFSNSHYKNCSSEVEKVLLMSLFQLFSLALPTHFD